MTQYISKDALLAEMESLRCSTFTDFGEGFNAAVQTILKVIDTLEVKEVDLEKKTEESIDGMEKFNKKIYEDGITWLFGHHCLECDHLTFAQHEVKELAKYFYELSYHQKEVLKRLKAQKGE